MNYKDLHYIDVTPFHENMSLRSKDVEGDIHTQKDIMINVSGSQFLMKGGHCQFFWDAQQCCLANTSWHSFKMSRATHPSTQCYIPLCHIPKDLNSHIFHRIRDSQHIKNYSIINRAEIHLTLLLLSKASFK